MEWPSFRDPKGGIWVWDSESHSYVYKDSEDMQPDRGHIFGGDADLFSPNQIEHSEVSSTPELAGHMAATTVRCTNCDEETKDEACPRCGKSLKPEWNNREDEKSDNEFEDAASPNERSDAFYSLPDRVPKRNRMKTDDSFPSMVSSLEMAHKLAFNRLSDQDWDALFSDQPQADPNHLVEIGKWIQDRNHRFHYEHGMSNSNGDIPWIDHQMLADRHGVSWEDVGALGSVYNNGTADVQGPAPTGPRLNHDYNHEYTQGQIQQAFGPVTLSKPISQQETHDDGDVVKMITSGQWLVQPPSGQSFVRGQAWVRERPEGQFLPHMILCAEHLQPEDYTLYGNGVKAIVTATGGLTSHAAYLASTEGIPVVVGIGAEYNKIQTGSHLKIDPTTHTITVSPAIPQDPDQRRQIGEQVFQYMKERDPYTQKPVFAHALEEEQWRLANDPTLDSCPECSDPMMDKGGESVCHTCGHKQPIVHMAQGPLIPLEIAGAESLMGGAAAGGAAGAEGGLSGMGLGRMGLLMNGAMGQGKGQDPAEEQPTDSFNPLTANAYGEPPTSDIDWGSNDPESPGPCQHCGKPANPHLTNDLTGELWCDDCGQNSGPGEEEYYRDHPREFHAAFGEEEVGTATKNRGENSDPEHDGSGDSWKEKGDGPELLKDVDGGGPKDPDPELQAKATKAFELNKPLVLEFFNSDESAADHPIIKALDELLEAAFPGYKDGEDKESDDALDSFEDSLKDLPEVTSEDNPDAENEPPTKDKHEASLWDHIALDTGMTPYGMPMMDQGQMQQMQTAQPTPCPKCGLPHDPSLPCPMSPENMQQPGTGQGIGNPTPGIQMATPPIPQKVITKFKDEFGDWTANYDDLGHELSEPHWDSRENAHPDDVAYFQRTLTQMSVDELQSLLAEQKLSPEGASYVQQELEGRSEQGGEIGPDYDFDRTPEETYGDHIAATYALYGEPEHHKHHKHHDEAQATPDGDWVDETGQPLQEGAEYELKSSNYAIPDRVTIDSITPGKVIATIHSGDVDYQTDITKQDLDTNGYTFGAATDTGVDSEDGTDMGDTPPIRPGQDPTPQVTDISDTDTKVSGLEDYTGSFKGDNPDLRAHILGGGSSEVEVDPALMAKFAGKDMSPREQREFIDEDGEARNLDKLELTGTHYVMDDVDSDFNW